MSILITGSSGYLGSELVSYLSRDYRVIGLDQIPPRNYQLKLNNYHPYVGSILDVKLLSQIMSLNKVETIIHLAAKKNVSESFLRPDLYEKVNVKGTKILLQAGKIFQIKKFIFASTAAVYSETKDGEVFENSTLNPLSPYGLSKLRGEELVQESHRIGNFDSSILRIFNIAGAGPNSDLNGDQNLIPLLLQRLRSKEQIVIYKSLLPTPDLTCIRDYVHILDVVKAFSLVQSTEFPLPQILNIGSSTPTSTLAIFNKIRNIIGTSVDAHLADARKGDISRIFSNISKARETLNFQPKYTLDEIIESSISSLMLN